MSATVIENDLDTDFFSVVDFELAPPCDLRNDCGVQAEWKFFTNCCGTLYLTCDPHLQHLRMWVSVEHLRRVAKCNRCKNQVTGPEFIVGLEKI